MKIIYSVITMFMLSTLSAANEIVIVSDTKGLPISGAKVIAMSYSIDMKSVLTNYRGEAALKTNVQTLKWVNVEKEGYESLHVQITGEWPLYVQLHDQQSR